MYIRSSNGRDRGISIPENYSGNAFSEVSNAPEPTESEKTVLEVDITDDTAVKEKQNDQGLLKKLLPINIGSEELIIIGIALLIFQSGDEDGIIPLLLAVLFLG